LRPVRGWHPVLRLMLMTILACGGQGADPDVPPEGEGRVVDWTDPDKVVEAEGWTVTACEGDAPLLCVGREGVTVGVVEAISFPLDSFEDLDPSADPEANLERLAADFFEAIRSDREIGCGPGYQFDELPPEPFVLGGTPGMAYGLRGTMPDGSPSEFNLQYATISGDQILLITAVAYDEGGCSGRDDLSTFHSATLAQFQPLLEDLLHESPLPQL
jgi:hypothetical protein